MRVSSLDKPMFQSAYQIEVAESEQLLEYLLWCRRTDVHDQISSSGFGSSSPTWAEWVQQTFVGFSSNRLLIQSGHRVASAFLVDPCVTPSSNLGVRSFVRSILSSLTGKYLVKDGPRSVEKYLAAFQEYYPDFEIPEAHRAFVEMHPLSYFFTCESYLLREERSEPRSILEVGAGAGVNVCIYLSMHPGLSVSIVDLPETIPVGYAFLKSVFPSLRVRLPHETAECESADYDVNYYLPHQVDLIESDQHDLAFNHSSFQEMDLEVVNSYLGLIHRALKAGGVFCSLNVEQSRYRLDNRIESYDLTAFGSAPKVKEAPYANTHCRQVGERARFLEVCKAT